MKALSVRPDMPMCKKKILILYHSGNESLSNNVFIGLTDLFDDSEDYQVQKFNYINCLRSDSSGIEEMISGSDIILVHFSILYLRVLPDFAYTLRHLSLMSESNAIKIVMPQDEGNYPTLLDQLFVFWKVDLILSVHYSEESPLYPMSRHSSHIERVLPVFIPNNWIDETEYEPLTLSRKKIIVGYRGRPVILKYGSASYRKSDLPVKLKDYLSKKKIHHDISISQHDRLYGDAWEEFLGSCRTVYGCEGGYSSIDFQGSTNKLAEHIETNIPNIDRSNFSAMMPVGWDDYELFTLTSRHLEAAYTGAAQILVEGRYKGILKPDRHYISIKSDMSNVGEVIEKINDIPFLENTVKNIREDIFGHELTYKALRQKIELHVDSLVINKSVYSSKLSKNDLDAMRVGITSTLDAQSAFWLYKKNKISVVKEEGVIEVAACDDRWARGLTFLKGLLYRHYRHIRKIVYGLGSFVRRRKYQVQKIMSRLVSVSRKQFYLLRRPVARFVKKLIGGG